jgi:outer membrane protein TolC
MRSISIATVLGLPLLISACATYHPLPLAKSPDLAARPVLLVNVSRLRLPGVKTHPFNAKNGLDMTEVAELAVINNPTLRAARRKAGIGRAQLFAAGLLPDPQLSLGFNHTTTPETAITGPLANGFSYGLSQALNALVTRGAAEAAQRAALRQINLNIVWQEWQVAQRARQLFIRRRGQDKLLKVVKAVRSVESRAYRRSQRALAAHNTTIDKAGANLVALLNAETKLRTLRRQMNQTRHALTAVLGLKPTVKLHLVGNFGEKPLDPKRYRRARRLLVAQRPDLLALRAGYASQDATVRKAILGQFPALTFGVTRSRDNSSIYDTGFSINLSLPFFNGNRGNIAIARATRAQLHAAYQARLDAAYGDLDQLWREVGILRDELHQVRKRLPVLQNITTKTRHAFKAGNIGAITFATLEISLLNTRNQAIGLRESLAEAQVALETLVGRPLPRLTSSNSRKSSHP